MSGTTAKHNKTFVLEAFETLFNKRDYVAAERFWSDRYIQHGAHIAPGRDGLFNLVRTSPDTLKYETHQGHAAIREFFNYLGGTLFPDFGFQPEDIKVLVETPEQGFAEYTA